MLLNFVGKLIFWRGPAPWFFIKIPKVISSQIKAVSKDVTYGWGMIPVTATINSTSWKTALFFKDGHYLLPVKSQIRKTEKLEEGNDFEVNMEITGL